MPKRFFTHYVVLLASLCCPLGKISAEGAGLLWRGTSPQLPLPPTLEQRVSQLTTRINMLEQHISSRPSSLVDSVRRLHTGYKVLGTTFLIFKYLRHRWRQAQLDEQQKEEKRLQQEERKKRYAPIAKEQARTQAVAAARDNQDLLTKELELITQTKKFIDSLPAGAQKDLWQTHYNTWTDAHFKLFAATQQRIASLVASSSIRQPALAIA